LIFGSDPSEDVVLVAVEFTVGMFLFWSSFHTPFYGTIGPLLIISKISVGLVGVGISTLLVELSSHVYSIADRENTSPKAVC
jgi:hypothetical protein